MIRCVRKNGIILLSLLFAATVCHAEDVIDYRNRFSTQMLTSANITGIAKDSKGFIWIATQHELAKFDGATYYPIHKELNDRLYENSNIVYTLYMQSCDRLLIGSVRGFYCYDIRYHTLKHIAAKVGRVYSILTIKGKLYLNSSHGIYRYTPGTAETDDRVDMLFDYGATARAENRISQSLSFFSTDTSGNVWALTNRYLLRLPPLDELENAAVTGVQPKTDTLAKYARPTRMTIDNYNQIWIWNQDAVSVFNILKNNTLQLISTWAMEVAALHFEKEYGFLCNRGKENFILHRNEKGEITQWEKLTIGKYFDDMSNTTNVYYTDERHNLWIGTHDGLFMTPFGKKTPFFKIRNDLAKERSLNHNTVSCLYVQGQNTVWAGTAYGLEEITFNGPASNNDYTIRHHLDRRSSDNFVNNNKPECIVEDNKGMMWIGTKGKLKFYDPRRDIYLQKPTVEQALGERLFVRAMYRDHHDNIWVGFSLDGLFCCGADDTVTEVKTPKDQSVGCRSIVGMTSGEIWVSTRNDGILCIEKSVSGDLRPTKQYFLKDTVSSRARVVNALYVDKYNNIWAGTDMGLYKYSKERDAFIHMHINFGNHSRHIVGLIGDNRGNLWLSALTGVYRYNISEGSAFFTMLDEGKFARNGFVFGCAIDNDGFIYLGGINGVTFFDPDNVLPDTTQYHVRITDFRVHYQPISYIIGEDINYVKRVTLRYRDNHFSFSFAALSYTGQENIRYCYMLEGVDPEWIDAGYDGGNITYNNLPPGSHQLKLRCTNALGQWQDEVTSVMIDILPPLLARWYFLLLYALMLGGIIWLIVRFLSLRMTLRSQSEFEGFKRNFFSDLSRNVKMLQSPYTENGQTIAPVVAEDKNAASPLVYITDRNRNLLEYVAQMSLPEIRVRTFDDPDALYEEALRQKPNVILSSLVFDGERKGLALCERIKSNPDTNDIPFMLVTSHSNKEEEKNLYEHGGDAFLAKPFDMDHLKKRILFLVHSQENIREKAKREFILNPKIIKLESADDKFLSKAMTVIEKNLSDEKFSVDTFASAMCLSTSMLYRRVKTITGLSPNELIRNYRLKCAAQLLASKAYNVSEVAFRVGFSDIRYFSTCFKKEYGMPPSIYQQDKQKTL